MAAIINKNHVHGNDVRSFRRKQICTLSEKVTWTVHKIIKNAGYKEKNNKPEVHSGLALDMPSTTKQGMMKSNSAPNFLYREKNNAAQKRVNLWN